MIHSLKKICAAALLLMISVTTSQANDSDIEDSSEAEVTYKYRNHTPDDYDDDTSSKIIIIGKKSDLYMAAHVVSDVVTKSCGGLFVKEIFGSIQLGTALDMLNMGEFNRPLYKALIYAHFLSDFADTFLGMNTGSYIAAPTGILLLARYVWARKPQKEAHAVHQKAD